MKWKREIPGELHNMDQSVGAVVIDWAKRTVEWHGMDGYEDMEPAAVLALLAEYESKPNTLAYGLIFWHDEGQLAVHDATGFADETDSADENG